MDKDLSILTRREANGYALLNCTGDSGMAIDDRMFAGDHDRTGSGDFQAGRAHWQIPSGPSSPAFNLLLPVHRYCPDRAFSALPVQARLIAAGTDVRPVRPRTKSYIANWGDLPSNAS